MINFNVAIRLCKSSCHIASVRKISYRKISQALVPIVGKDPSKVGQDARINMPISEDKNYDEWRNNVLHFCEKMELKEKQFLAMCYSAPRLKSPEMQEHLLKVSEILRGSGFESWTRIVIHINFIKFMNINVECISHALEEHRKFVLLDEKNQESLDNIKQASDVYLVDKNMFERFIAQKAKEKSWRSNIKLYFPMRRIAIQNLPHNSLVNFLSSRLEIEERVVAEIWPANIKFEEQITNKNLNYVYSTIERISMLLEAGASKYDILENYHLFSVWANSEIKNYDLLNAIQEQNSYIHGKVNLEEVRKYIVPKSVHSTSLKLQKLLSIKSQKSFNKVDRSQLIGKSLINAVRVFFLLSDEGFKKTELQKYMYLLSVDESEIKQYIKSKKGGRTEQMANLVKVTVKESSIDFPNLGPDLRTNMAFKALTIGEKFLQEMQLYFEFRKDDKLL